MLVGMNQPPRIWILLLLRTFERQQEKARVMHLICNVPYFEYLEGNFLGWSIILFIRIELDCRLSGHIR